MLNAQTYKYKTCSKNLWSTAKVLVGTFLANNDGLRRQNKRKQ